MPNIFKILFIIKKPATVVKEIIRYIKLIVPVSTNVDRKLELKYEGRLTCRAEKKPTMPMVYSKAGFFTME